MNTPNDKEQPQRRNTMPIKSLHVVRALNFDMEKITNNQRKAIRSLSTTKGRKAEGAFAVEGTKSVLDMLNSPFSLRWLVATSAWYESHPEIDCAPEYMLRAVTADMERISSLNTPPEVIAVFDIPLPEHYEPTDKVLTLAVDGVQDPGNMGTILRLCDWFGVKDVLASRDTVDVYNPKCVMATMGSIGRVRVHYVDLADVLNRARSSGVTVWGTFLDGKSIYNLETDQPHTGIIVMGNEGKGISPAVATAVTHRLLIPSYHSMTTGRSKSITSTATTACSKTQHTTNSAALEPKHADCPESLNVAMATAITLFAFRQPQ